MPARPNAATIVEMDQEIRRAGLLGALLQAFSTDIHAGTPANDLVFWVECAGTPGPAPLTHEMHEACFILIAVALREADWEDPQEVLYEDVHHSIFSATVFEFLTNLHKRHLTHGSK